MRRGRRARFWGCRLFLGQLFRGRELRVTPATAQGLDQLHTRRHLLHLQTHRRPLIRQQRRLRRDHIQITIDARLVTLRRQRQRPLRRRYRRILLVQLVRQNPQRRQIIFHFLKRRQHRLPVRRHGRIVIRARNLRRRRSPSLIKQRLTQRWTKREEPRRPRKPARQRRTLQPSRSTQNQRRKERRFCHPN